MNIPLSRSNVYFPHLDLNSASIQCYAMHSCHQTHTCCTTARMWHVLELGPPSMPSTCPSIEACDMDSYQPSHNMHSKSCRCETTSAEIAINICMCLCISRCWAWTEHKCIAYVLRFYQWIIRKNKAQQILATASEMRAYEFTYLAIILTVEVEANVLHFSTRVSAFISHLDPLAITHTSTCKKQHLQFLFVRAICQAFCQRNSAGKVIQESSMKICLTAIDIFIRGEPITNVQLHFLTKNIQIQRNSFVFRVLMEINLVIWSCFYRMDKKNSHHKWINPNLI